MASDVSRTIVLTSLASVLFFIYGVNANGPEVKAPIGSFRGKVHTVEGVETDQFLGIPFAQPPLGSLRFAHPVPVEHIGELDATQFSAKCLQPLIYPQPQNQSEDCLYLNVFRKSGTKQDDDKPVIVIFHGGAWTFGSASEILYFGSPLAGLGDVIVVSFNYRLGIFGFADMGDVAPGNLGLFDQRLALEWVQDNIAAFGGDPDRVTLMGVSAGSMSVSAHISTPLNRVGRKLFHAAVMDAGVMAQGIVDDPDLCLKRIEKVAETIGCKTAGKAMLNCLRRADADELLKRSYDPEGYSVVFSFHPTVDGVFVPTEFSKDLRTSADDFVKVKILLGYGKDEGTMFAANSFDATTFPNLNTENEFLDWCGKLASGFRYPMDLQDTVVRQRVSEAYYQKTSSRFYDAAAFIADGTFTCPINAFVKSYAKFNQHVYVYRFERRLRKKYMMFDPDVLGVYHGSPYAQMVGCFLELGSIIPNFKVDAEDRAFSLDAIQTIVGFARSDDPPTFRGLQWPDFSASKGVMVLDDDPRIEIDLSNQGKCKEVFPFFELESTRDQNKKMEL